MVEHHIVESNKMITAVEWFYQRILAEDIKVVFEQAKAMEKEQIVDAATWGALAETGEKYYNEKYKK
jgi:hypothetical protein